MLGHVCSHVSINEYRIASESESENGVLDIYIYMCVCVCMYIYIYIWVFPKIMVPQNHPFVHRVWNHCKPSILGHPIFGNTHIYVYIYIYRERERERERYYTCRNIM